MSQPVTFPVKGSFKICMECGGDFHVLMYSQNNKKYATLRSKCKKCESRIQVDRRVRRKAEKHPHRYYECSNEDCGHVWSKSWGEKCIRCKSPRET